MAKNEIPPEVRRFILTSIPSVPHLEALMLLRSTAPTCWSITEVAQRLYVPPSVAREVVVYLSDAGMLQCVEPEPVYCFQDGSADMREMVDAVAHQYSTNLVEITHLIHSRLARKAQQFADAFNLRKES